MYVCDLVNDGVVDSGSQKRSAKSQKRAILKRQRTKASATNDIVNIAFDPDSTSPNGLDAVRDLATGKFPHLQNVHFCVKIETEDHDPDKETE